MMSSCRVAVMAAAIFPVGACMSMDEVSDTLATKVVLDPADGPAAKQAAICWSATVDQQRRADGDAEALRAVDASKDYWGQRLARLSPVKGGPETLLRSAGPAYEERVNSVPSDQRAAKAAEIFAECRSLQQVAGNS
jgi:hypothetical protein